MSKKTFSVTGTGDSLFVAKFPKEYDEGLAKVAEFIKSCDARLTNLETTLTDFEFFGNQYSGGTWLSTRRKYVEELFRYGFNYFGNANNHCMDYSYNGLLSTIKVLDSYGVAHSGTGDCLEAAEAPAILEFDGKKVAVFAVDASFANPSMAGQATRFLKARPGVNYLRHETAYRISEEEMAFLKDLCRKTKINYSRENSIATGYKTPDPEGVFFVGNNKYTTQDGPTTTCKAKDLARITADIRKARETCDQAFVLVHCHDCDNVRSENPPEYLVEFAHACIDAGAGAIFGGGCHRLRGMEMYKGYPIFYSLGDFIYQGPKVEFLPAEFMEAYSVDINSTAEQALLARSRGNTVGLHCNKKNYQTFLPKLTFGEDGRMVSMALLPIDLNFDRKDDMNGLPVIAGEADAAEILALMNELSAQFGVTLKLENGMMVLA